MNHNKPPNEPFVTEIRRQAERIRGGKHSTFWRGLSSIGAVGWMVSLPPVVGALLGRWLDVQFASGIFWTLSLLGAGLLLGCVSAWRHVTEELKQ